VMQAEEVQAAEVGRIATNWCHWRQPRNSLIPKARKRGSLEGWECSSCSRLEAFTALSRTTGTPSTSAAPHSPP
jgi:hypothetical protein